MWRPHLECSIRRGKLQGIKGRDGESALLEMSNISVTTSGATLRLTCISTAQCCDTISLRVNTLVEAYSEVGIPALQPVQLALSLLKLALGTGDRTQYQEQSKYGNSFRNVASVQTTSQCKCASPAVYSKDRVTQHTIYCVQRRQSTTAHHLLCTAQTE